MQALFLKKQRVYRLRREKQTAQRRSSRAVFPYKWLIRPIWLSKFERVCTALGTGVAATGATDVAE